MRLKEEDWKEIWRSRTVAVGTTVANWTCQPTEWWSHFNSQKNNQIRHKYKQQWFYEYILRMTTHVQNRGNNFYRLNKVMEKISSHKETIVVNAVNIWIKWSYDDIWEFWEWVINELNTKYLLNFAQMRRKYKHLFPA